jgi:hypothetical protein
MIKLFNFSSLLSTGCLLFALTACQKDDYGKFPLPTPSKINTTFYALAAGVALDKFSVDDVQNIASSATITGLQAGERILAIDFRPATGQLYGLSSSSRLYVINPQTGAARAIGAEPFSPLLSGDIAGFDFNPTVDRIRVVTSTGQNLRLNPETGAVAAEDGTINGQPGAMLAGAAYDTNEAGAATTTLYDIDLVSQKLFKQMPPNDGTLVEVGPLGKNITGEGGFDISAKDGLALGLFEVDTKPTLFSVNLTTGKATILAIFDKERRYTGIAIPTNPVGYATDATNNLLIFNPEKPGQAVTKPITGLTSGDQVVGIDFRPLNGQLFALSTTGTIYTVNASNGAAVVNGRLSTALQGTHVGFDFNPVVDRIRIISNTGQNLRYNPNDGTLLVDGMLNPGMPAVTASAYANNFAGTTSTMLFNIDTEADKLYLQNPPNDGTLGEIGSLGIPVDASNGFDIGGTSGIAYALLTSNGSTKLYSINTTTGVATAKGDFSSQVNGFALGLGF